MESSTIFLWTYSGSSSNLVAITQNPPLYHLFAILNLRSQVSCIFPKTSFLSLIASGSRSLFLLTLGTGASLPSVLGWRAAHSLVCPRRLAKDSVLVHFHRRTFSLLHAQRGGGGGRL